VECQQQHRLRQLPPAAALLAQQPLPQLAVLVCQLQQHGLQHGLLALLSCQQHHLNAPPAALLQEAGQA
jgi:hypothetical protein